MSGILTVVSHSSFIHIRKQGRLLRSASLRTLSKRLYLRPDSLLFLNSDTVCAKRLQITASVEVCIPAQQYANLAPAAFQTIRCAAPASTPAASRCHDQRRSSHGVDHMVSGQCFWRRERLIRQRFTGQKKSPLLQRCRTGWSSGQLPRANRRKQQGISAVAQHCILADAVHPACAAAHKNTAMLRYLQPDLPR